MPRLYCHHHINVRSYATFLLKLFSIPSIGILIKSESPCCSQLLLENLFRSRRGREMKCILVQHVSMERLKLLWLPPVFTLSLEKQLIWLTLQKWLDISRRWKYRTNNLRKIKKNQFWIWEFTLFSTMNNKNPCILTSASKSIWYCWGKICCYHVIFLHFPFQFW